MEEIVHHPSCERSRRALDHCPCGATQRAIWRDASRRLEVNSQAELDAIEWDGDTIAVVRKGFYVARDSATVEAWDSATVRAGGSATVRAGGSATVEAWGSATVRAGGSATVRAWDSATGISPDTMHSTGGRHGDEYSFGWVDDATPLGPTG